MFIIDKIDKLLSAPQEVNYEELIKTLGVCCTKLQLQEELKSYVKHKVHKAKVTKVKFPDDNHLTLYYVSRRVKKDKRKEFSITINKKNLIHKLETLDAENKLKDFLSSSKNFLQYSSHSLLRDVYIKTVNKFKLRKEIKNKENLIIHKHHIVPRCMKGKDLEENLVKITLEEHKLFHAMLFLMYPRNADLYNAFIKMELGNDEDNTIFETCYQKDKYIAKQYAKMRLYNAIEDGTLVMENKEKELFKEAIMNQSKIP